MISASTLGNPANRSEPNDLYDFSALAAGVGSASRQPAVNARKSGEPVGTERSVRIFDGGGGR